MDNHIKGALLVCLAATMWGFDGIALTPRLFSLHVPFVVFILHLLPLILMSILFGKEEVKNIKHGINFAKKVLTTGEKYHTLLSQRFDRTQDGKRIHFASAMTLLGLNDGDNATTGHGYLDIVDFIIQNCTNVEDNLQELYRRVAFNICIGNSDDHFRNHGFLLTAKGWTLSPAYDMNPTLNEYQSLLVSSTSNKAELGILLDTCEDYMLNRKTAETIILEVIEAVKGWRELAVRLGISKREMDMFAGVLDERYK